MNIYGHPIKCNEKDLAWIKQQLAKNPHKHLTHGIIDSYSKVYSRHACPVMDEGRARREANAKLRRYIQRLQDANK